MLTIEGRQQTFCDGVSRRSFLKIGGLALGSLGGFTLADLYRAEAATGTGSRQKSVINIFRLSGVRPGQQPMTGLHVAHRPFTGGGASQPGTTQRES